jgi:DNA-binding HxlR family transcriptional regulator
MDGPTASPYCSKSTSATAWALFGPCPTHWLIRQLKDRWSLPVLSALRTSTRRFSELREELHPVSPRMLGRTLRKLIQIGFVTRTATGMPTQVRYELTQLGRSVAPPFVRLLHWSQRNAGHITAAGAGSRKPDDRGA